MTTLTLLVAVVFVMTLEPAATGCLVALGLAVVAGPLGAVPLRRGRARGETALAGSASS